MLVVQVKVTEVATHLFITVSTAVLELNLLATHHDGCATAMLIVNRH